MDIKLPPTIERLIDRFSRLPGIGRRTAQRLALSVLNWSEQDLAAFGDDLTNLHRRVRRCSCCGNYTESDLCVVCASPKRNRSVVCVVEQASQIAVFENSGSFDGLYHVLGGRLSPLSGTGPDALNIRQLQERVAAGGIQELILATSPDVEGEATANYLAGLFRDSGIEISRIASGLPAGADVGYADSATLSLALGGRRSMQRP
ncbi:MAG: recombination protein RecR [Victivallales bacterium]|nr:recombination protein RecR [Victivallales bacterium]